jgi:hypothetical protein
VALLLALLNLVLFLFQNLIAKALASDVFVCLLIANVDVFFDIRFSRCNLGRKRFGPAIIILQQAYAGFASLRLASSRAFFECPPKFVRMRDSESKLSSLRLRTNLPRSLQ